MRLNIKYFPKNRIGTLQSANLPYVLCSKKRKRRSTFERTDFQLILKWHTQWLQTKAIISFRCAYGVHIRSQKEVTRVVLFHFSNNLQASGSVAARTENVRYDLIDTRVKGRYSSYFYYPGWRRAATATTTTTTTSKTFNGRTSGARKN